MSARLRYDGYPWMVAIFLLLLAWPAMTVQAGESAERIGRTTLVVEKITCGACIRVIDSELRKIPGILGLTANLEDGQIKVDHDLGITPVDVAEAIIACGYPARVIEVEALPRSQARLFRRGPGFGTGPGCCNLGGANPVADSWRELRRRLMRQNRNR